jgi:hypothetical protein
MPPLTTTEFLFWLSGFATASMCVGIFVISEVFRIGDFESKPVVKRLYQGGAVCIAGAILFAGCVVYKFFNQ